MSELKYMISEAARQVDVESHVLRYWEDELALTVSRNEQGHRYYTQKDIQLFCCIRKLKDEGLSLKEIRGLLPDLMKARDRYQASHPHRKSDTSQTNRPNDKAATAETKPILHQGNEPHTQMDVFTENNLKEMRSLIGAVVSEAVSENNQSLKKDISRSVTTEVLQEMGELFASKEQREEEHYRKLDCLIRQQQAYRKENARSTPFQSIAAKVFAIDRH
ncbi:MAG: helix-turn-helix domain-containing protein [Hespellia sp.]|nr:helix-turn-helix domain-containing protein [Hespellia sp.]